ncbi:MAG TPA: SRPBCC family protein [Steroidobacteraceae bacterium]|nr:SRPBCC family protein [Steroidobacteraceae bacterium]
MTTLLSDDQIVDRVLMHAANKTTDVGDRVWREPVENYRSLNRLNDETELVFRKSFTAFCPSAALPEAGSFIARDAAGRPVVVVRGTDGVVRAFQNVCRHRGMRLAQEQGRNNAFVCTYHGWTYDLQGCLRSVPHESGFPGLDKSQHGLAALSVVERNGIVFVNQTGVDQSGEASRDELNDLPELIDASWKLHKMATRESEANWKIVLEGFLEGYHIRTTHAGTFYQYGFDNLNVIEHFGRNSRVTFPFRRIQKLEQVPAEKRRVLGYATFVYHLFPNALITVLSNHINLIVLEPLGIDRTRLVTYTLVDGKDMAAALKDMEYTSAGGAEDTAVVCAIQRGVTSNANQHFTFGRFEGAIVHFHQMLDRVLCASSAAR